MESHLISDMELFVHAKRLAELFNRPSTRQKIYNNNIYRNNIEAIDKYINHTMLLVHFTIFGNNYLQITPFLIVTETAD
jgi:hypothetical protein